MAQAELFKALASTDCACKRVAHELDVVYAARLVPTLFKGKNRQQQVNVAPYISQAVRAPGPNLRADVVDDAQATATKGTRQSEIKIGPVNKHYRVGPALN